MKKNKPGVGEALLDDNKKLSQEELLDYTSQEELEDEERQGVGEQEEIEEEQEEMGDTEGVEDEQKDLDWKEARAILKDAADSVTDSLEDYNRKQVIAGLRERFNNKERSFELYTAILSLEVVFDGIA